MSRGMEGLRDESSKKDCDMGVLRCGVLSDEEVGI